MNTFRFVAGSIPVIHPANGVAIRMHCSTLLGKSRGFVLRWDSSKAVPATRLDVLPHTYKSRRPARRNTTAGMDSRLSIPPEYWNATAVTRGGGALAFSALALGRDLSGARNAFSAACGAQSSVVVEIEDPDEAEDEKQQVQPGIHLKQAVSAAAQCDCRKDNAHRHPFGRIAPGARLVVGQVRCPPRLGEADRRQDPRHDLREKVSNPGPRTDLAAHRRSLAGLGRAQKGGT